MTDKELYDYVLDKAVELTESQIGFFHQVSEDEREIILTTWNATAMKNCTAVYDNHYTLRDAGNWVDCVRQRKPVVYNDYEHSPNQRGLPAGHAVLRRFMSIPVVSKDRVRIIFGVGNKGEDYTEEDVSQLQLVANEMHKIMVQREAGKRLRLQALMLDQIRDIVTVTDTRGKILYVNRAMTEVLGRSESEVLGHAVMEYGAYGDSAVSRREQLERTLVEGYAVDEVVTEDAGGQETVPEVRTTLLRDVDGSAVGVCGVGTDVTLRRKADKFRQALLSMSDQLNQTRSPLDAGRALVLAAERLWHWDAAELEVFADDGTFVTVIRVAAE
ncbi:MAG: GAF domain-containing protein, partial [Limisphaerales bacterium]